MENMEKEDLIGLTEILGWKDITTKRQKNNGTQIFELPIKFYHGGGKIKVGSFKRGYVRRMNGCYTPYQLNKTEDYDHFYPEWKWKDLGDSNSELTHVKTGKYNKHVCRKRILIEDETDRLQYLIDYCLRNYYIGYANRLSSDQYVTKWKHEYEMKNGSIDRVIELQKEVTCWKDLADEWKKRFEENDMELDELTVSVNGHRYKVI